MSDREDHQLGGTPDSPDMEKETKRLMDEAIAKEFATSDTDETTTAQIDVTFQRLQTRMEDLLSTIEDTLKAVGPDLDVKTVQIVESLNKKLANAGLGVFATRAAKIVKDELESELSVDDVFKPVHEVIEKSRAKIVDIIEKTTKGAARNVEQSTGSLQAKLLQMYVKLGEVDKQLEITRSEVRKWRGKANELEELMKQRENLMTQSSEEIFRMHESIKELNIQLQEKDDTISELKGELGQARAQAEQQQDLLKALNSAEQVAANYEAKVLELSQIQGQLVQATEQLGQKDDELSALRTELERITQEKMSADSQISEMSEKLALLMGSERDYQAEVDGMNTRVAELQARWDALYRIAEDDPTFKAYFLIADKTQWFQLSHLSSALGIPTVLLKRNLQKFVDVGLLEINGDRIRPRSFSNLIKDMKSSDEELIRSAQTESDEKETESIESKDSLISTPEYTRPEKGDDYEQDGR
ncbi:MAG: hypothetical protein AM326_12075 [Candidatus Thorarchaeota archaeon SMTZ-45]|nr:MAG: hypothetical protein AM326_12075 [Candidatus Thorarchaeota archaeon SMTZ-45]KXH73836.1 MAG: hypothetical protein AM325_13525 [Candidatus Thorarchaeota archaeon SMTZ1-45]